MLNTAYVVLAVDWLISVCVEIINRFNQHTN